MLLTLSLASNAILFTASYETSSDAFTRCSTLLSPTLVLCVSTSVTRSLDSAEALQTAKRPRRNSLQADIVRVLPNVEFIRLTLEFLPGRPVCGFLYPLLVAVVSHPIGCCTGNVIT